MILPINKIGDPVLETPCEPISFKREPLFNGRHILSTRCANSLEIFIAQMIETAIHHDAVGLAANQVGESLRIFIFRKDCSLNDKSELKNYKWEVAINPRIDYSSDFGESQKEGCLSVPKIEAGIWRSNLICGQFYNEKGEKERFQYRGLIARIFSHELDHLNGINFLERANGNIRYIK